MNVVDSRDILITGGPIYIHDSEKDIFFHNLKPPSSYVFLYLSGYRHFPVYVVVLVSATEIKISDLVTLLVSLTLFASTHSNNVWSSPCGVILHGSAVNFSDSEVVYLMSNDIRRAVYMLRV